MAGLAEVEFFQAPFDGRAWADLLAIRSDTVADVRAYKDGCESGAMQCVAIMVEGERRGTLVASWLQEDALVFVANAARIEVIDGQDMTGALFDMCSEWAVSRGAEKLRFWTARRGLSLAADKRGFRTMFVLEKDLKNVGR